MKELPRELPRTLEPPLISESMEFETILTEARDFVSVLADSLGTPHENMSCSTKHIPSPWEAQLSWALRTGAGAFLAMAYSLYDSTHVGHPWNWSTAEVLAPVVAFVVVAQSLGAGIKVVMQVLHGCTIGTLLSIGVVQMTISIIPPQYQNARDGVCFLLFAFAALFLVSRKDVGLTSTKFSCANIVISCYQFVRAGRDPKIFAPLMNITPCVVGCACGIVALLLPWPVLASDEVARRIRLQSEYIRIILDEHLLLVLRSEAAVQSHSELLLTNIEENRVKIKSLLPCMGVEMFLSGRGQSAVNFLTEAASYFDSQVPSIRGKQFTLRGRTLTGKKKMSNAQVLSLSRVTPAALDLNRCLARLSNYVLLAKPTDYEDQGASSSNTNTSYTTRYSKVVDDLKDATRKFEEVYEAHRVDTFYKRGRIRVSHARSLRDSQLPVAEESKDEEEDPFSLAMERLLELEYGSEIHESAKHLAAATTVQLKSPLITSEDARNPRKNPALYGAEFEKFNAEHGRRLSHIFFRIEHAKKCLAFVSDTGGEDTSSNKDGSVGGSSDVGEKCISLFKNIASFTSELWTATGLRRGPKGKDEWLTSIKRTLPLVLSSTLSFTPRVRETTPQSYWAALAVCFLFTDDAKGVGASIAISEVRLLGTSLGAVFGLLAVSITSEGVWPAFFVGAWGALTGLFRGDPVKGYAAVCAGFTAAIIIQGGVTLTEADDDDEFELTPESLSLHRIKMNFIGVLSVLFVQLLFLPKSVRSLVMNAQVPILENIGNGITKALSPFSTSACMPSGNEDEGSASSAYEMKHDDDSPRVSATSDDSNKHDRISEDHRDNDNLDCGKNRDDTANLHDDNSISNGSSFVTEARALLSSAGDEPTLWRRQFPKEHVAKILEAEASCFEILGLLQEAAAAAASNTSDAPTLAPSVAPTMLAFSSHVKEAVDSAAVAWACWDGENTPKNGRFTKISNAFNSAAQVAAPLLSLRYLTEKSILEQRDALFLQAFTARDPPPQRAALGWMAVCFLCQQLSDVILELGVAMRDTRSRESPMSDRIN